MMIFATQIKASEKLNDLNELRWKNRIILVSSVKDADKIISELKQKDGDVTERHILWFVFIGENVRTNYRGRIDSQFISKTLSNYLKKSPRSVLIGKDGGVKSSTKFFDLQSMLRLIDTMPMRQSEVRE